MKILKTTELKTHKVVSCWPDPGLIVKTTRIFNCTYPLDVIKLMNIYVGHVHVNDSDMNDADD